MPHRLWHPDFGPDVPADHLAAVKLWALCAPVAPGGGGTPQLAGSHALFARYLSSRPGLSYVDAKVGFLRSHPWLQELTTDRGEADRNRRLLDVEVDIDGLPARVVEVTGDAGDVVIAHGWVFHSIAANATPAPRLMRGVAIVEQPEVRA